MPTERSTRGPHCERLYRAAAGGLVVFVWLGVVGLGFSCLVSVSPLFPFVPSPKLVELRQGTDFIALVDDDRKGRRTFLAT